MILNLSFRFFYTPHSKGSFPPNCDPVFTIMRFPESAFPQGLSKMSKQGNLLSLAISRGTSYGFKPSWGSRTTSLTSNNEVEGETMQIQTPWRDYQRFSYWPLVPYLWELLVEVKNRREVG